MQGVAASPESKALRPLIEAIREIVAETGTMPPERVIAEQLQVKRHRLRRALESLRASGELDPAKAGRRPISEVRFSGDFASGTNPIEIVELRSIIEPALARLAAFRASPAEIARIQRSTVTPPDAEPGAVDLTFHRAVAAGARNSLASEVYALLRHVATDARLSLGSTDESRRCPKRVAERDSEHAAIASAIARRDPDAAERAMRDHLGVVHQQILGRLAPAFRAA